MQEEALQTILRHAVVQVLAQRDHPLSQVYRTLVQLATRHHALLIDEPLFGIGAALGQLVAAEVLGIPQEQLERHPDALLLFSDGALISNEVARGIIEKIGTRPAEDRRVVVWEDISRMNTASSNTLLKTLEEPPGNTLFLLTTTASQRMLSTILSRVLLVHLTSSMLESVTETLLSQAPENHQLALLSLGRPALAACLLLEREEKKKPLTNLVQQCHDIANHLLAESPEDKIAAYKALLAYKDADTLFRKKQGVLPVQPFPLLCMVIEGSIEKMLHSTMMTSLSPRAQDMASRILRFRQDMEANVSLKLAALDLVFGS